MAIDLNQHKVFVESLQMEMVPLSIARKAVEEATPEMDEQRVSELQAALEEFKQGLNELTQFDIDLDSVGNE